MKNFLLISFFVLFSQNMFSQEFTQSIIGVVQDRITGNPLPGANVILIDFKPVKGTTTDINGKFILKGVPVGLVSIRVSYIGYQTVEIHNRELRTGKNLKLQIFMDEHVVSGKEVVIEAKTDKREAINNMTTVSTRTFSIDETRRYAGSRGDIARMASNFAGVQVASDSRNDIVIRGNSPSGLQWKLEGFEIANPNHYGAFGTTGGPVSILNNNLLNNSDFLTGAFPAEYGNALSGVFDIRLINGNIDNQEFLTMVGFNGFELGAEGPISKKNNSSYLANYRYSTMEIFELVGMDFGTGTAIPKYQDFTFKVTLPTKNAGRFSVFGIWGKSKIEFLDSERDSSEVDFYGGDGWDLLTGSEMAVVGLSHSFAIGKNSVLLSGIAFTHQYYWVNQDSISPVDNSVIPYYYSNFRENRLMFRTKMKTKINKSFNFQTGIMIIHYNDNLHDSIFIEDFNKFQNLTCYNGTSNLIRPFVSAQIKMSEKLKANLGVNYMFYTYNSTSSIEPRAGISFEITHDSKLGLAYGLHSQTLDPATYNRETYIGNGEYITMNRDLKMLSSNHFVLSYDYYLSEYLRFKTELYYQSIFNAAVNASKNDTYSILNEGADFYIWTPDTLKSTGTGRNYGVELTIEHFLKKGFYGLSTISLFESKYKGSDGIERNTAFSSNFVTNILIGKEWELHKNSVNPKLKTKKRHIGFDIRVNWAGGRRYTPIDTLKSQQQHQPVYITSQTFAKHFKNYFRTDIKVFFKYGGKKSNYEMGVDIQNLFDTQNIYSQNFNTSTGKIYYTYELGIMVIPYVRFEF